MMKVMADQLFQEQQDSMAQRDHIRKLEQALKDAKVTIDAALELELEYKT